MILIQWTIPVGKTSLSCKWMSRNSVVSIQVARSTDECIVERDDIVGVNRDTYSFKMTYRVETQSEPMISYTVYPLELKQTDRHRMQENPHHIPDPQIYERSSFTFTLPVDSAILCVMMMQDHTIPLAHNRTSLFQALPTSRRQPMHSHHPRPYRRLQDICIDPSQTFRSRRAAPYEGTETRQDRRERLTIL